MSLSPPPSGDLAHQFAADVEAFLTRTGMAPSQFGRAAVNDTHFVFHLRAGRSPSLRMVDRVRAFMASHAGEEAA